MDHNLLMSTMLFRGLTAEELEETLEYLQAYQKCYAKGTVIFSAGSSTDYMGLVLSGSVTIENNDLWGNRTILSHAGVGAFFAETYALLPEQVMLVDVCANQDCQILFLRLRNFSQWAGMGKAWQGKLAANLLQICAHKNLILSGRSFHTAPKTIRGRVLSYLNAVSLEAGSPEVEVPFDRQQMADYLNVERTALSKELGKMVREGLIVCHGRHFVLNGTE